MKTMRFFVGFAALGLMVAVQLAAAGQTATATGQPGEKPQLVILDTDIGDDIDDAFALALVLRSPELKLLGITTAFGDTELRAKLVDRYLWNVVGMHTFPVIPGVPTQRSGTLSQAAYARAEDYFPQCGRAVSFIFDSKMEADGARWAEERKRDDAAGFLLDQIRAHPGEITLIAIGPLLNIQAAIERDPATFRKLKRVVIMGGSVYRGYGGTPESPRPAEAEWNIKCDPAGAKALLAVGVPVFVMPLDSTQIHLETAEREKIFAHGSPLTDQLTLLYHQWMSGNPNHSPTPTLYDPVAVTYAIRPDLCPTTPLRLEVDDKGFTRPVEGEPNAQVCLKSDEKGFLDLLLSRITTDPGR